MQNAHQSPPPADLKLRPKFSRTPLRPKNSLANNPPTEIHQILKPKPKKEAFFSCELNKENQPTHASTESAKKAVMETLDASLAEELSAIRKKIERLRIDKDRTEKMLEEREKVLDLQMKELENRGEVQKKLEIEVDRLFRLMELPSCSTRISPIRSLREKQNEKKDHVHWQEMRSEDMEVSVSGSPCLSCSSSSNSVSSQPVAVK